MEENPSSESVNSPAIGDGGSLRPSSWSSSAVNVQFNQQINNFSDFSGFKEIGELPPEIQKAALEYFQREQSARHLWVTKDQNHVHDMKKVKQNDDAKLNAVGQLLGVFCLISMLIFSGWMIMIGQGVVGISTLLFEIGGVIYIIRFAKKMNRSKKVSEGKDETAELTDSSS